MPPILIIIGLTAFAAWLFSPDEKPTPDAPQPLEPARGGNTLPPPPDDDLSASAGIPVYATASEEPPVTVSQGVTLEILREIFEDGARSLRRRDAVEILKAAPYFIPKTNAYRALAPSRRFAAHLWEDENGWLRFSS